MDYRRPCAGALSVKKDVLLAKLRDTKVENPKKSPIGDFYCIGNFRISCDF